MLLAALLLAAAPAAGPVPPAEAETFFKCDKDTGVEKLLCQALAAQMSGQFAKSAGFFEAGAGMLSPGDPVIDKMLAAAGNMWIAADQPGKAAAALDKALAGAGLLGPQRGETLLDRARAAEAQNDLKTARAKITAAAETIPEDPFLWFFSAGVALRENDVPAAKVAIGRALALEPKDPTILFEAGHVHHSAGDEGKARAYWTQAATLDPNGKPGQAAKAALAMLDVPVQVSGQPASEGRK